MCQLVLYKSTEEEKNICIYTVVTAVTVVRKIMQPITNIFVHFFITLSVFLESAI